MVAQTSRRESARSARRENIIGVARSFFLEKGFAETSMSEIAGVVGGSKGTLWRYFSSKQELFAAVIQRAGSELNDSLEQSFRQEDGLRDTLLMFADRFVSELSSPLRINFLRVIAGEINRVPDLGAILLRDALSPMTQRLREYFISEIKAGRFLECDTGQAALQFLALVKQPVHVQLWYDLAPGRNGPHIDMIAAVDMFLRAHVPGVVERA